MALINLSNLILTGSAANAGAVVGAVSGPTGMPVVLGGADATKFALSNGGVIPCNLMVGSANVAAGPYAISLQPQAAPNSFAITVNTPVGPPPPPAFTIGEQVQTMGAANVRQTPGGTRLGSQPKGAVGTVMGGPTSAVFAGAVYVWWRLNFATGVNGWVAGDNLAAGSVAPPPPPLPPPPPPPPPPGTPPHAVAGNRPRLAGNVLSWSGPVGGGPWSSGASYVAQTRTLTPRAGNITTTAAGQIIEGLAITGTGAQDTGVITVAHNNVTIRQNSVQETTVDQPDRNLIVILPGVTGWIIEDNLLDGNARNGANSGGTSLVCGPGAVVSGGIMQRNYCTRSEQALRFVLNNIDFDENLMILIGGADADWFECYPNGGKCDNLRIRFNTFDGTNNPQLGADSGINLSTGSGLPTGTIGPNVIIDSNWFLNWKYPNTSNALHCVVFDDSGPPAGNLRFSFTNNGFFNCDTNIDAPTGPGSSCSPNSGNYVMATSTSTTGALWNGTGKL